jgi:thiol-disulfide isomerase/thioredoxin
MKVPAFARTEHVTGLLLVSALLLIVASRSLVAQDASHPTLASKKTKRRDIYDVKVDARAQVAAATAKCKRDNKHVLLMFGGNWCGWCHKLHELLASNAELHKLLHDEYELVLVDTEAPNAKELLKECTEGISGVGYPFLAVLDAEGKILTKQKTDPFEEGDHHVPERVKTFLTQWVAPPVEARRALDDALACARERGKMVFLHFGAPWCGWCHKLDDFLALEEIQTLLGRDFVDLKIDVDRMTHGQDVSQQFRGSTPSGGIPWFAFLDAKGKVLTTSDSRKGNIGYPAEPHEIDHFIGMLKAQTKQLTPEQINQVEKTLKELAKKIKAKQD